MQQYFAVFVVEEFCSRLSQVYRMSRLKLQFGG